MIAAMEAKYSKPKPAKKSKAKEQKRNGNSEKQRGFDAIIAVIEDGYENGYNSCHESAAKKERKKAKPYKAGKLKRGGSKMPDEEEHLKGYGSQHEPAAAPLQHTAAHFYLGVSFQKQGGIDAMIDLWS